MKMIQFVH